MRIKLEAPAGVSEEALAAEFRAARDLGKVRIGESGVFFTRLSGTAFLPWEAVERVWLRQEEVNARLCCGTANFDQFYLMVLGTDGRERKGQVLSKELGREALDRIGRLAPDLPLGKPGAAAGRA